MNTETVKSPEALYMPYRYSTENYVSTEYDEILRKSLIQNPVVFITGPAGCGKTQLARAYIKSRLRKDKHVKACEISQEYFSSAINKVLFNEQITDLEKIPSNVDIFAYLRSEERTSIILIDMEIYDKTLLSYISRAKALDNLSIIVTTSLRVDFEDYPVVSLNNHTFSDLKKIFYNPLSNSAKKRNVKKPSHYLIDFTDEELKQIFHIVDNNVMLISLIGKTLYEDACKNFDEKTAAVTKDSLLNPELWLWHSLNLPKIHDPYTDSEKLSPRYRVTLISHTLALILKNIEVDFYQEVLPILCFWAGSSIPLHSLIKAAGMKEMHIKKALQKRILEYTDNTKNCVKLKPFIYNALWYSYTSEKKYVQRQSQKIFDLNLNFCIAQLDKIQKFYMEGHNDELDFEKYNSITLTALNHIHYYFSTISNDKNVTQKKKDCERWNQYLIQLMCFYLERGNAGVAEKFLSRLFVVTNKHQKIIESPKLFQSMLIDLINTQKNSLQLNRLDLFKFDMEKLQNQPAKYRNQLTLYPELYPCITDCLHIHIENIMNCLNRFILVQTFVPDLKNHHLACLAEIYKRMLDIYESYSIISSSEQSDLSLYYYRITYYCLLSQNDTHYLNHVFSILSILENRLSENSELFIKAEMQLLQCMLTVAFLDGIESSINYRLKQHMFHIMKVFHFRMSFDTIILFFSTRIKYICLSSREETADSIKQKLRKCIDSFYTVIETQLTMDEEYKQNLLNFLQNLRDEMLPQYFS